MCRIGPGSTPAASASASALMMADSARAAAGVEGLQGPHHVDQDSRRPAWRWLPRPISLAMGCNVHCARCRCASRTIGPVAAGLSSAGRTPKPADRRRARAPAACRPAPCQVRGTDRRPLPKLRVHARRRRLRHALDHQRLSRACPRNAARMAAMSSAELSGKGTICEPIGASRKMSRKSGFDLVQHAPPTMPRAAGVPCRPRVSPCRSRSGNAEPRPPARFRTPAACLGDAHAIGARDAVAGGNVPVGHGTSRSRRSERRTRPAGPANAPQQRHSAPGQQVGAGSHRASARPPSQRLTQACTVAVSSANAAMRRDDSFPAPP